MKRAVILVLDSFGLGATDDAHKFNDAGSNTLGNIASACAAGRADEGRRGVLRLPELSKLGLMHAAAESSGTFPAGADQTVEVIGAYGFAEELSTGKDTSSGHWEITGVPVLFDWTYFTDKTDSIPVDILNALIEATGIPGVLGNCHASGTEIIARLGEEHQRTGKPIVYTSADSVLQIACHEESFGLDRLLQLCEVSRTLLDEHNVCRVIARPFVGSDASNYQRTGNRRDFSVVPPQPTMLDRMIEHGGEVISVGKIADIFAQQGISKKIKATGLTDLFDKTLSALSEAGDNSIVFTNFVDFDSSYGHRRDVPGYARALEYFDSRLPELLNQLQPDDVLVITADHGCDPTWPGSDHTREHIPVIVYGDKVQPGSLGKRGTFADIGQSLAAWFGLPELEFGTSFF
ncbi:phosphopentomutase [Pseudomaricurvus alkylphenolicus]|uniref:phosphopentomutase n=1 Tax=Pseudomaricurvus alkylphenolicus TaxID=1306991 RepID=UPI00142460F3|nr:phosphopentomutase [Pseudomaricurvus alkylphenolicus]NIB42399.1 phosphopentomutase [Pseudomaricurvus alkylphenolicus]